MPLLYVVAAFLEIAGCFAVWSWWRGASVLWLVPGALSLAGFAALLAVAPQTSSGRAFAIYGGIYIAACVLWLWAVDGTVPTRADLVGAGLAVAGAAVILLGQRA